MKPLYDLQQELNRLFIAGSKFAKNDPRLQKHVPILKKLGEKAPVFNKLAQEVEALLQLESTQAAAKLLGVSTLLYSVLYNKPLPKAAQDVWKYCKMPLSARYLTIHVLMDI